MPNINPNSRTTIDEIVPNIYRISTSVDILEIPGGFTFNQYLIVDNDPLLFHTGPFQMFPAISEAVATVIPINSLRYIGLSHFEADECGSLNKWLDASPNAVPLCGQIAAMLSIQDIAIRSPRAMHDGEVLSLGQYEVQWHDAAHVPHGWDCGYLFETKSRTLFCGDLFTQPGNNLEPITEKDILESSEMMRHKMDYYAHGTNQKQIFDKLSALKPKVLACMHGSAWKGDGAQLLNALSQRIGI